MLSVRYPLAALAIWAFAVALFLGVPTGDGSRGPSNQFLPPTSQWKLVGVYPLNAVNTGHPQGLNISRDTLSLSLQASPASKMHRYKITRVNGVISKIDYQSTFNFAAYNGLLHAGGLGRSRDRETVYVPVAAIMFGETAIVAINGSSTKEIARYPFHIGAVFVDPDLNVIHSIGRDVNVVFETYGNSIHTLDLSTHAQVATPFKPLAPNQFQDCKPFGASRFLCTNKAGSNFFALRGSLDLIRVARDGSYVTLASLPVPHVNLDGSFGAWWGPYIPGYLGSPPLSYNPFDFEISDDHKSLYFYFAPDDFPDTRLYCYRLDLN